MADPTASVDPKRDMALNCPDDLAGQLLVHFAHPEDIMSEASLTVIT